MHLCFWRVVVGAFQYLWDCLLNPWVWIRTQRPGLPSCHVTSHLGSVGGRHWILPPLSSLPVSVLRSLVWSLSTSPELASLDSGIPVRLSWPASYLELLLWGRGSLSFQIKYESKTFRKSSSPLPWTSFLCPRWRIEEISILIGSHVAKLTSSFFAIDFLVVFSNVDFHINLFREIAIFGSINQYP